MTEVQNETRKRRHIGSKKKSGKSKKKQKMVPFNENRGKKIDPKMKKLFQKRARDYNSDDDEDNDDNMDFEESAHVVAGDGENDEFEDNYFEGEENEVSEDEGAEIQPGITRFADGCNTFKMAFKAILKKTATDDVLGPVLSGNKKLVAEKLAEEDTERKVKAEAKKEKHMIGEKGHVKPANYLDSHEKVMIGIATKGVVKLFNGVNKAQHAQRGLNPSSSKDEKIIKKRRKDAFLSELGKRKVEASAGSKDKDGHAWAPLRNNYMLTNPKLKDWDKKLDTTTGDDFGMPVDTDFSSDED